MKRPLAVTGFTFLAALAVALHLGEDYYLPMACTALLGFAVSLKSKVLRTKKVFPLCFAVVFAAVCFLSVYSTVMVQPSAELRGKEAEASGAMCELPYEQYGRYYYTVSADRITANDGTVLTNTKMLISSSEKLAAEPYDIITGKVSINDNISASDLAKGIRLRGYFTTPEEVTVIQGSKRPLYYYALRIRSFLSERIHSLLPEKQADFISALILGEKTGVSENTRNSLSRSGISHIIVVSGFHLAVITQLLMLLFGFILRERKRHSAMLCILILLFYMAITGFSPSVVRAGIMQITAFAAVIFFRVPDSLTSLGLSVLIMTLSDPFSAGDVGLLLSYFATLGILLLSDKIASFLKSVLMPFVSRYTDSFRSLFTFCTKAVVSAFSVTLSAFVFILPLIVLYFREIAIYSILTNLLVFAVVPLMIGSAFLMLIFDVSVVLSFLALPLGYFSAVLTEYICAVSDMISRLPYAVINVSQSFIPYWLFLSAVLAGVLYLMKNVRRRVSIFVFTLVLTFVSGSVVSELMNEGITRIAVLNTPNGLAVAAVSDNSAMIFACGGSKSDIRKLSDYLDGTLTSEVSLLLLTDNRYGISNNAGDILENYTVELLEVYDEESYKESVRSSFVLAENKLSHISERSPYNRLVIDDTVTESFVSGENRAVLADIHGLRILLCTDRTDCEQLPQKWKKVDYLIVNGRVFHTSEIDCETIIITGKSVDEITGKAYEKKDRVYYTFNGGNVIIRADKNNNTQIRRDDLWLS